MVIFDRQTRVRFFIFFLVLTFCGFLGFCSFSAYERPSSEPIKVEIVEIVGHISGRSGKAAAQPYFLAMFPSGVQVKIPDWGEIQYSYLGPAVIDVRKNKFGAHHYSINVMQTLKLSELQRKQPKTEATVKEN